MSKLTKSCALSSCKFSKGTRQNVKMFRVPTDQERLKLWKQALCLRENEVLKGLLCVNHFEEKDVSVGKTNTRLKRGAIPTSLANCSNNSNGLYTDDTDNCEHYEEYEKLESDEENETAEISEIREEIKNVKSVKHFE